MPSSRRSDSGIEPKSLFRLLHWQAGSLPLASLGKPTVLSLAQTKLVPSVPITDCSLFSLAAGVGYMQRSE